MQTPSTGPKSPRIVTAIERALMPYSSNSAGKWVGWRTIQGAVRTAVEEAGYTMGLNETPEKSDHAIGSVPAPTPVIMGDEHTKYRVVFVADEVRHCVYSNFYPIH